MRNLFLPCLLALVGCGGQTSFVKSDTTLGRVVVYRNGVAYFERYAKVDKDVLRLAVPADKVDDFLKSLTVVNAKTGEPAPISYPTSPQYDPNSTGLIDMDITLAGPGPHELRLSYVTEAPSWKPSYRVVIEKGGKVNVQAWAIVDNTSGEDWQNVNLGVGSSSALSFHYDLRSVRLVQRETLQADTLFALAPPTGGATHGGLPVAKEKRVVGELSDEVVQNAGNNYGPQRSFESATGQAPMANMPAPPPPAPMAESRSYSAGASVSRGGGGRSAPAPRAAPMKRPEPPRAGAAMPTTPHREEPAYPQGAPMPPMQMQTQAAQPSQAGISAMASSLRSTRNQVIVEGYADPSDGDKFAASLDRANKVREQLIREGVPASQVIAVGNGEQSGRRGGVRIVEAPPGGAKDRSKSPTVEDVEAQATAGALATEPIGTSHFESESRMTVPRGTSAMVSILGTDTEGEVVYFYDPESVRGNTQFPFRAVRIKNPTDSVLESGPVSVFGEGKFIGEGLADPIPARSVAFVPFALDRQIVVDKDQKERDEIARILTVQRGVFSTEVQHLKRTTLTLNNRMDEKATVYIRHAVPKGYKLVKSPASQERIGAAYLFRVEVAPNAKTEVVLEEATPLFKSTDIRSTDGIGLIKAYLSSSAMDSGLKASVGELLKLNQDMGNLEQQIATMREQMQEHRTRMDELHAQIVTLKAVKTKGGSLMQHLEKKLEEVSEKLSKATIDLVGLQEKLMVARIRFQDGVAELSLDKKPDPAAPPAAPKAEPAAAPKPAKAAKTKG
jgi:hypothetical protein